jgi:ubiquinone/menaquinone biosynthesis C-methylase UbiE
MDGRSTFATVWQGVDANRHTSGTLVTPDPLAYLRGFDKQTCVVPYKQQLLASCDLKVGQYVLDVGCGLGQQTAALCAAVTKAGRVCAVDISHDSIREASAQASAAHATFSVADAYCLPFGDGEFDAAVSDRVLQHLVCPRDALAEIMRVVRPGHLFVIQHFFSATLEFYST